MDWMCKYQRGPGGPSKPQASQYTFNTTCRLHPCSALLSSALQILTSGCASYSSDLLLVRSSDKWSHQWQLTQNVSHLVAGSWQVMGGSRGESGKTNRPQAAKGGTPLSPACEPNELKSMQGLPSTWSWCAHGWDFQASREE